MVHHFIIKELAEEFVKQFTHSGKNTKKYITFTIPMEKEFTKIDKKENKLQKKYHTYYNLLIAQDFWKAHYQILSINFLKEFIELNLNTDMMIKNVKLAKLHTSIATVFLNI